MRLIDADALEPTNAGLVDAVGNFYGAADFVFLDDIINAATVDPVRHGKWIGTKVDISGHTCMECSICHKIRISAL